MTPRRRAAWRPLAAAAAGAALLTTTLFGARATAVLAGDDRAALSSAGRAGSGSLSLVLVGRGRGLTQQVADLAPGDRVHRYVDLVSGGSLAATGLGLQVSATPQSPLTRDTATSRGLRAQVSQCEGGPWQPATGLCRGRTVELLPETPLAALVAVRPVPAGRLTPGGVLHLRLRLVLPDQDETTASGVLPAGSVQGRRAALTWSFSTRQAP